MGIFKALTVGTKVLLKASGAIIKGTTNTVVTTAKFAEAVTRGDAVGATRVVGNKIANMAVAGCATAKNVGDLLDEAEKCANDKNRPFLTKETERKLVATAALGTAVGVGAYLGCSDGDDASDSSSDSMDPPAINHWTESGDTLTCPIDGDDCDAILARNDDRLTDLISEGEIDGTEHVDSDDVHRSMAVRNHFLHDHGFDSVPEGYEVHHKIPLSQGGPDSTDNMILVSEEDHDRITAEHRKFYHWNS